jgi:hypothetical protein
MISSAKLDDPIEHRERFRLKRHGLQKSVVNAHVETNSVPLIKSSFVV